MDTQEVDSMEIGLWTPPFDKNVMEGFLSFSVINEIVQTSSKIGTYHCCHLGSARESLHGSSFTNLCQKGNDTRYLFPSNGPLSILPCIIHCGPVSLLGCHSMRTQGSINNNQFSGYGSLASSKETLRILASIPVMYAFTWSACYVIEPWGLNIKKCLEAENEHEGTCSYAFTLMYSELAEKGGHLTSN